MILNIVADRVRSPLFFHEALTVLHIVVILHPVCEGSIKKFLQLKLCLVVLTNVVVLGTLFQIWDQELKFLVFGVLFERSDWNSIFKLLAKRIDSVVKQ